jgi:predicted transcriptional regulator
LTRLYDIFENIFVPTTVHIPDRLLAAVDRRARALRVSRNRLIVRALEREVVDTCAWSPGFLETLRGVTPDAAAGADEMLDAIRKRRASKPHPAL